MHRDLYRICFAALLAMPVLPAAAQAPADNPTVPLAVVQELEQAGVTDIQVMPGSLMLHATDKEGRSVTMIVGPPGPATPNPPNPIADSERQFMAAAARAMNNAAALSALATTRGSTPAVKRYAQQVAGDRDAFDHALREGAAPYGVILPQTLPPEQRSHLAQLAGLSGVAFDHAYLQDIAQIEVQQTRSFDLEASRTAIAPLKSFLQTFSPLAARRGHDALALDVSR